MYKTVFTGPFRLRARSFANFLSILAGVACRRLVGRPRVPEWTAIFEFGTLYWRAQFNRAFAMADIAASRACLDSLHFPPVRPPAVDIRPSAHGEPRGDWFIPHRRKHEATMLYLHGGGYSFYAAVTRQFIALLAEKLGIAIFAPDYRLTPEHPHPAQLEDALAAWHFLRQDASRELLVAGDSAGGHLTLMLLVRLRTAELPQPTLAIALSPWTDTGRRGKSQFGNDPYDLVQGYMTLRFAQWLKGDRPWTDAELSPIEQDLRGLAPIYLQAGGKEILVDMIRDFAIALRRQGGTVRLDVWEHMNHEFQAYGDYLPESSEALARIDEAIARRSQPPVDGFFSPAHAGAAEVSGIGQTAPPGQ